MVVADAEDEVPAFCAACGAEAPLGQQVCLALHLVEGEGVDAPVAREGGQDAPVPLRRGITGETYVPTLQAVVVEHQHPIVA